MNKILEGIRIIDMTDSIAGPYATSLLAGCGAEVIRVESRLRFGFRRQGAWGFKGSGPTPVTDEQIRDYSISPLFSYLNSNKLSITLNMAKPESINLIKRLIKISDVVVNNFRFGVMQKWGLDYPDLKKIKDNIISIGLQGMGCTGPYRQWVTWAVNLLSFAGFDYEWGYPGDVERASSTAYADFVSGEIAATYIITAIYYRARTGKGQFIDLAQDEALAGALGPIYMDYFVNQRNTVPLGNRNSQYAPYNCYRCLGDDSWCVIAVRSEDEWRCFVDALGRPNWANDEKFKNMNCRLKNVKELDISVEDWTKQYTPHQVMNILQAFGVAAGAVQNGENTFHDIHLRANNFFVNQNLPRLGEVTMPGTPVHFSDTDIDLPHRAPILGEHNKYVYSKLMGIPENEIKDMEREQIIW